ncbi:MAG: hypothetical protein ABEN55_04025 [Bradymonadaceae bacterium]
MPDDTDQTPHVPYGVLEDDESSRSGEYESTQYRIRYVDGVPTIERMTVRIEPSAPNDEG